MIDAAIRFRVTRTSIWDDDSPCPEATLGTYTEHVYCTLPLDEAMVSPRTGWFRELSNHRPTTSGSVADRTSPCWYVDMSMAGLEEFCKKYGKVVLSWHSDGPTIEIYDTWRE